MAAIALKEVWNACFENMVIVDQEGSVLDLNRSAIRLFSLGPSDFAGISLYELLGDKSFGKYLKADQETTGISVCIGTQELIANVVPLSRNLEQSRYLIILKNMTQQQQLKYQLQAMNETKLIFDAVLDELEEGVCVVNTEGRILFYNRKMGEIDLREPASVKGRRIFDVWPALDEQSSTLLTAMKLSKPLHHRETHFTPNGKAVTTLSRTAPLFVGEKKLGAIQVLRDITEQKQLAESIQQLRKADETKPASPRQLPGSNQTRFQFTDIVYVSREMGQTVELARRAARSASNVLIIGETGTGKELFAQSIHNESPRKSAPFIAQNCAALPEGLLEGLLFGTAPGSFTGAVDRPGLFEQANGGTLLLDELNAMGPNLQAKLLRVLQEKKCQRLGSAKVVDVDVRIIATINEDPMEAIRHGRLREDLFYRLSVVNIYIPPLRKRKEDIPALIDAFLAKHAKALDVKVTGFDPDVYRHLLDFPWPGNVRQLEHVIEGCLNLMYDEGPIRFEHLPYAFREMIIRQLPDSLPDAPRTETTPFRLSGSLEEQVARLERELIRQALREANGNITKAGERLGISRQNLNYKLKKHGMFSDPT
jgi:arginine utilization regulatory protein